MARFALSTLRNRVLLLLCLQFAVTLVLLAYLALSDREKLIENARERVLHATKLIVAEQKRIVLHAQHLLAEVVLLPEVSNDGVSGACQEALAAKLTQASYFINLGIAQLNGDITCAAVPAARPVNISDRDYFRRVLETRGFVISDFVISRATGKGTIAFARPVLDGSQRLRGVAFAGLDLAWLNRHMTEADFPEGSRLAVIDGRGGIAARYPDPEGWTGKSMPEAPLLKLLLSKGGEGTADELGIDGVRRIYAFAPLLETSSGRLSIWIGVPKAAALAPVERDFLVGLAITSALLLLSFAATWWGSERWVLRRIRTLSQAAGTVGKGDFSVRTGLPHTGDELGLLARSFDEMAAGLQAGEYRYRTLFDESPDGLVVIDPETTLPIDFNAAMCNLLGYTREEFAHLRTSDYEAVETPEQTREHIRRVLETGRDDFQTWNRTKTGEIKEMLISVRVIELSGRKAFYALFRDITPIKRAEQSVIESEERFRTLVEAAHDATILMDSEGKIAFWNRAAESIFEYSPQQALGQELHRLIVRPQDRASFEKGFETFRTSGQGPIVGRTIELVAVRSDGTNFPIELSVAAIKRQGAWHAMGVVRDITRRRRAEEDLRQAKEYLERLIDYANAPIVVWSPLYEITRFNRAFEHLTGYDAAEVMGQKLEMLFPEYSRGDSLGKIRQTLTGEQWESMEIPVLRKDGNVRVALWNSANIYAADGKTLMATIAQGQDISIHKEHQSKISKLNALLMVIRRINEELLVAKAEAPLFQQVSDALLALEGITAVTIWLKGADFEVKPAACAGIALEEQAAVKIRWDDSEYSRGPTGSAIRTGRPVLMGTEQIDADLAPWKQALMARNVRFVASLPLVHDTETIGALTVLSVREEAFGDEEMAFLNEVADDIAIGVRSLRLSIRLEKTLESLRKTLDGTVEAIAQMTEIRDPYTAGHERHVAKLAAAIAKEMGFPEKRIEGLRTMGYLHDIGKITVPAEILSKPGKLNEFEFGIIKNHPQVGYDILKTLEFPWPVAQAVLQHHERLDGSGYPNGLKGDEIILEARIMAVADVVESMGSHRPYRPALGIEKALEEIRTNKGRLYDPDVVDVCLKLFTEKEFKIE